MDRKILFVAGMHRSGTSLVHRILKSHPEISGFSGTGVPKDEGQHLQSVYPPAQDFGGPGRFAFDEAAYMDETHPLATAETSRELAREWGRHWDLGKPVLVEKSPPTIIRTRFFQQLFPQASFLIIMRHPLAIAYATRKWVKDRPVSSLVDHTLLCYERFVRDRPALNRASLIYYEDLVARPERTINGIFRWLDLDLAPVTESVKKDVNAKYFRMWESDRQNPAFRVRFGWANVVKRLERRSRRFGYDFSRSGHY